MIQVYVCISDEATLTFITYCGQTGPRRIQLYWAKPKKEHMLVAPLFYHFFWTVISDFRSSYSFLCRFCSFSSARFQSWPIASLDQNFFWGHWYFILRFRAKLIHATDNMLKGIRGFRFVVVWMRFIGFHDSKETLLSYGYFMVTRIRLFSILHEECYVFLLSMDSLLENTRYQSHGQNSRTCLC